MAARKLEPGTYGYDGPTEGAHYCGRNWSGYGNRDHHWAVWSIEPTDATCVACGEGFRSGAATVKLVELDAKAMNYASFHGVINQRTASSRAAKVAEVYHVRCVDWAQWYVAWDLRISASDPLVKLKRTQIERAGIGGLLGSPTRVTLAERFRNPDDISATAERVQSELGISLDQLTLFFERSDARQPALAA